MTAVPAARGRQAVGERERVAHGVQDVHPVGRAEGVQTGDRRPLWHSAGTDDQPVVADLRCRSAAVASAGDTPAGRVDRGHRGVGDQADPCRGQLGGAAVGQAAPVGHFAGDVVRDAADGEVRISVGEHHAHLRVPGKLARPQRRADPGVAAAHNHQPHARLPTITPGTTSRTSNTARTRPPGLDLAERPLRQRCAALVAERERSHNLFRHTFGRYPPSQARSGEQPGSSQQAM
jgi:hypothetical protein